MAFLLAFPFAGAPLAACAPPLAFRADFGFAGSGVAASPSFWMRSQIPVIICDGWTDAQVRAFRLLVNRSATWADFDEELLAIELQELNTADFDLELTGFNTKEIDDLLALPEEEKANEAPPLPTNPVSRLGDLWACGKHRVLCGDATSADDVSRLLADRKPLLMVRAQVQPQVRAAAATASGTDAAGGVGRVRARGAARAQVATARIPLRHSGCSARRWKPISERCRTEDPRESAH